MAKRLLIKFSVAYISLMCILLPDTVYASTMLSYSEEVQKKTKKVTGKILGEADKLPIVGATIISTDGSNYAIAYTDGKFELTCSEGEQFNVSFLGYLEQTFTITESDNYIIHLKEKALSADEVVVVGYGVQRKATVTGSVAAITGDDMVKTKNTNIQNMLTGRVPGLRVVQKTSEPGSFSMDFDIRGFGAPLIIIDGIPRTNMSRLDPNEIESISILKDASAAIYGVQAANGVVLITTKKGTRDGKVTIQYSNNMTWQMIADQPENVSAVDFMLMANEKALTQVNGGGIVTYSPEEIEEYASGAKQETNWNDAIFRDYAPQTQQNLSISGGNEKTNFYINMGYQSQEGLFTSNDLNYDRYNVRTKVNTKITDDLTFDINLAGISDNKNSSRFSSNDIIRTTWKQFPTDPLYANNNSDYYYSVSTDEIMNPLALMDSDYVGYNEENKKWFQSSASLNYDVPFVPGLSLKGLFSYDYNMGEDKVYNRSYNLYKYDSENDRYNATPKDSPSSIYKDFFDLEKTMYQISASYNAEFNSHSLNGLVLLEGATQKRDNFYAKRELSLDVDDLFAGNEENQVGSMNNNKDNLYKNAQLALVGRLSYNFQRKYLAEFTFRYDGSSRFNEDNRFGFFPSASVGYMISEENFWKNSWLKTINSFKVRASYGVMGDDGSLNYQYLSGYNYPNGSSYFGNQLINGVGSTGIANPQITWYTAHTMNFGIDLQAFENKLGATFDIFQRERSGLLAKSENTLPGTVGANLPEENLNSDRTIGFEVELNYRDRIGALNYRVGANMAVTRQINSYIEETEQRGSYYEWRNGKSDRYQNVYWGYNAGGQYHNYDQIAEFPVKTGRSTLPGSYYYQDWNGDGFIDGSDQHPIGFGSTPLLNFGVTIDLEYKGFDLNVLFQGSAMSNIAYNNKLRNAWENVFPPLDFWADRWMPTETGSDPYSYNTEWTEGTYPSSGAPELKDRSEFDVHNNAYIRLKNIELGYTFPQKWLSKLGVKSTRVHISGYNLLTLSKLDFIDPETPSDNNSYIYPLNKTITVGLNITF